MNRAIPSGRAAGPSDRSRDASPPVGSIPIAVFSASDMLADDVAQIVQRLPYLEVAPAHMFTAGLLSELADASDRLALKVAKLTERKCAA